MSWIYARPLLGSCGRCGCGCCGGWRLGRHGLAFADDSDATDNDGFEGLVFGVAINAGDSGYEFDGVSVALAEDGVLVVELGHGHFGYEELTTISIGAGV